MFHNFLSTDLDEKSEHCQPVTLARCLRDVPVLCVVMHHMHLSPGLLAVHRVLRTSLGALLRPVKVELRRLA